MGDEQTIVPVDTIRHGVSRILDGGITEYVVIHILPVALSPKMVAHRPVDGRRELDRVLFHLPGITESIHDDSRCDVPCTPGKILASSTLS